jgi:hypothetical protein
VIHEMTCPGQKGNTSWQSVRVGSENVRAGTDSGANTGCGADDGIGMTDRSKQMIAGGGQAEIADGQAAR